MNQGSGATFLGAWALIVVALASGVLAANDGKISQPHKDKTLGKGKKVPNFSATNQLDELWKSETHLPMNLTIIWFYRGDFLPKCRNQARRFRDQVPDLHKNGVQIIGVSGDTVSNHLQFSENYGLNFTLLEDDRGNIAKLFGIDFEEGGRARLLDKNERTVIDPKTDRPVFLSRGVTYLSPWIFVVGDGTIIYKEPGRGPKKDVDAVVEFLRDRKRQ